MTLFMKRSGVAVVELFGTIGGGVRVPVYSQLLDGIRRSKRIKAVVLDIDSPGGTAPGSELLYHSLSRVAREKPVVAYVRGIDASGAYYISCAASKIVALPSSLVGSIGVIYMRPVLQQLLEKLGVSFSIYKEGHLKDMTGFWRSPTSEEAGKFQGLVDEIYANFVGAVATGRKMDVDRVRELATGEVFTGRGAKERGLVDELGDFDAALEIAAELGKARRRPIWVRPKRPFIERMFGRSYGSGLLAGIGPELERAMMGGLYFIAPSYYTGSLRDD